MKPNLVQGTRDFTPEIVAKRNYIFQNIKSTFEKYGFQPLETPSMERLDVLTGKYGEEGDQLIFKILNSGDFLEKITPENLAEGSKKFANKISEKALRYDLTVPFARFVAMNSGKITMPFKRYQIQPVWRGDRPGKGRFREFYQCDADIVGTKSLVCEADIVMMINEVFGKLKLNDFTIKINHRLVLSGLAEYIGGVDKVVDLCVAMDKLDKIGWEKVAQELQSRGFEETQIQKLEPIISQKQDFISQLDFIKNAFSDSELGKKGVADLEEIINLLKIITNQNDINDLLKNLSIEWDLTLARGLSYYTGAIFEVKINNVQMGSVSGGGRYDNLTGAFGLPNVAGVGFSFGVDRLYEVLEELKLFPEAVGNTTQVLFVQFDKTTLPYILPLANACRNIEIRTEIYPDASKLGKQFGYADEKNILYVVIAGSDEIQKNIVTVRNMTTGEQQSVGKNELVVFLKNLF